MTSPLKPWEMNRQNMGHFSKDQWSNNRPLMNSEFAGTVSDSSLNEKGLPPPLPPRPIDRNNQYSRYQSYNHFSPYNSFNGLSGPYNSMYNYGFGGNRYGYNYDCYNNFSDNNNSFIHIAEESSRPAFQSIESFVHAVGSVSMMLESTYHAVHSSFRAVLGVAEHFSRLRNHLTRILSTLAIIRTLQWCCRRILYLLGLIKENPAAEQAWNNASKLPMSLDENDRKRPKASWPILMYFAVVFGAPWLIWKLLNSIARNPDSDSNHWATKNEDYYLGIAQYNFHAEEPREISFQAGQELVLAPKNLQPKVKGLLLASTDGKKVGLVPANYVKILGFRTGLKYQNQNNEFVQVHSSDNSNRKDSEVNTNDMNQD
ncbi:peroxisomal membrane protein PEX13-like [Centruroides sculpturatus]|uniref:peroxisomal membrane protein PEX13-like n=1 Tax=Centruroides sculpturatus TaxID=218467 RepID=UPI000C6EFFEB|nr:peroxisomal membrane protein PEX13-like [Centruroides sculpturatus]